MSLPHDDCHQFVSGPGAVEVDDPLELSNAITVEAWVSTAANGGDAIQPLVSAWAPTPEMTRFDAYAAGTTDGLDSTGFFGAVFDGRHIYFAPQHDNDNRHCKVLRYDTHGAFKDATAWEAYDAGETSGLNTKGYYGAIADGRYITFIPRRDSEDFHSRILRKNDTYWDQRLQPDKGHYEALDRFADAVLNDTPSPCDEIDGARATCMALKAQESIRLNQAVDICGDEYHLPLRRT